MYIIPFHNIDPVILQITDTISLNWYGLSYLFGVAFATLYGEHLAQKSSISFPPNIFKDFIFSAMLGIVIGGRLGEVFFYHFSHYLHHPIEIFYTWKGGMSFHGGLIGGIIAAILHVRKYKVRFFSFSDVFASTAPISLMAGRLANFINGELFGKPTTVPWAIPFPKGGYIPRHPSQLYEAFLEGILLFIVMQFIYKRFHQFRGFTSGCFLIGYGIARFVAEFFREGDSLDLIPNAFLSAGQMLSFPMIIAGVCLFYYAKKHPRNYSSPQ